MSRTIEEQLKIAQQKVNRLKTKVATQQKQQQRAKRKELDHKKYTLAGNVLKILNMNVLEAEDNLNLIVAKLSEIEELEEVKKDFLARKGNRILEKWKEEE